MDQVERAADLLVRERPDPSHTVTALPCRKGAERLHQQNVSQAARHKRRPHLGGPKFGIQKLKRAAQDGCGGLARRDVDEWRKRIEQELGVAVFEDEGCAEQDRFVAFVACDVEMRSVEQRDPILGLQA